MQQSLAFKVKKKYVILLLLGDRDSVTVTQVTHYPWLPQHGTLPQLEGVSFDVTLMFIKAAHHLEVCLSL